MYLFMFCFVRGRGGKVCKLGGVGCGVCVVG